MKKAVNKVPSPAELNRMLARSAKEVDLFDKLDAQPIWPIIPTGTPLIPLVLFPWPLKKAIWPAHALLPIPL